MAGEVCMTVHILLSPEPIQQCRCVEGRGEGTFLSDPAQFECLQLHRHIMASLLPLIFMFLWIQRAQMSEPPDLPFMEYLDQDRLVCLSWGFDNHQGNITFKLVVNTTGWMGFGFSPNGGMKGSDIIIGGIGPTGIYFAVRQYKKKCVCSSLCCYRL